MTASSMPTVSPWLVIRPSSSVLRPCLLVLLFLALASQGDAQVALKWQLKEGDEFFQETTTRTTQTIRFQGQEQKSLQHYVTVSSFRVTKAEQDGTVILEQTIVDVRPVNKDEASALPFPLSQIKDATLTFTLTPNGKVSNLEGHDLLIRRISGGDGNLEKIAKTLLSEESLRQAIEETFATAPKGPVQPGGKWERQRTQNLGPLGEFKLTSQYVAVGMEKLDGVEAFKVTTTTQMAYAPPAGDPGLLPFRITQGEVKVEEGQGALWFDVAAGRLHKGESRVKLTATLQVASGDQKQPLTLEQEQIVQFRVTNKNPGGS